MRRERYVIAAIVIIAFTIVAAPYYHAFDLRSSTAANQNQPALSPPLVPNPSYGSSKPTGVNVTVLGVMKASVIAPTCSLSNPPCAILDTSIYYVVVNGRNYRLIFQNASSIPANVAGANVVITGLYVTPSTFNPDQWTPVISFYGDIYVQKANFFYMLPQ